MLFLPALYRYDILHTFLVTRYHPLERGWLSDLVPVYRGFGRILVSSALSIIIIIPRDVLILSTRKGEVFALKFRFEPSYPISSPAVQFVVDNKYNAPLHPVNTSSDHLYRCCIIYLVFPLACLLKWPCRHSGRLQRPSLIADTWSSQICASILGSEWSPVLSVTAVCITLQSMLASCKVRPYSYASMKFHLHTHSATGEETVVIRYLFVQELVIDDPSISPPDNDHYVLHAPDNPKKVWHHLCWRIPELTIPNLSDAFRISR